MNNIDLKELKNIKEELEQMDKEDYAYIDENGKAKYVVMPIELFDKLEDYRTLIEGGAAQGNGPQIRVLGDKIEGLTYDEYEAIKRQIIDLFDKSFKPKADKLN